MDGIPNSVEIKFIPGITEPLLCKDMNHFNISQNHILLNK